MKRHDRVIGSRTGLRTIVSAGVLAVWMIVAAAVGAAIDGGSIEVWGGSHV